MLLRHAQLIVAVSIAVCCLAAVSLAGEADKAVSVSVNKSVAYQTIDGFGAHGAMDVWWGRGPFYNQAFLDRVIDDLGLTIVRNEYYPPDDNQCNFSKQRPISRR